MKQEIVEQEVLIYLKKLVHLIFLYINSDVRRKLGKEALVCGALTRIVAIVIPIIKEIVF